MSENIKTLNAYLHSDEWQEIQRELEEQIQACAIIIQESYERGDKTPLLHGSHHLTYQNIQLIQDVLSRVKDINGHLVRVSLEEIVEQKKRLVLIMKNEKGESRDAPTYSDNDMVRGKINIWLQLKGYVDSMIEFEKNGQNKPDDKDSIYEDGDSSQSGD